MYNQGTMKTMIAIDDSVIRELERQAAATGATVAQLIENAVRSMFPAPSAEPREFRLITAGRGGRGSKYDVTDTSELIDMDDLERYGSGR